MTVVFSDPATPFYTGVGVSSQTPKPYPAALNGRGYIIDTSFALGRREAWQHRSIPMLRAQADTGNVPGEQSLNPEGPWRRTQNSWHLGSGQMYLDRDDSDAARFFVSKGVDVFEEWELTLLNDTELKRASANTNLLIAHVGTHDYITDGAALLYTTDWSSFTGVTGMPAGAPTSIASDGFNVWVACNANGLYTTTRGAAAATQQVTSALAADSVVAYVKGRLMLTKGPAIYNITSAGPAALPTALFTNNNSDFVFVGMAEGPGFAYAAGYSGDKSIIYKLTIKTDGTGLDVPVVAGELPDGEIIRSIQGYLGFLCVGTDTGVRFCQLDSNGDVIPGDIITTGSAVQCFEPQDRFVWYGLTNYDSTSTGLGRMDLHTIDDESLAPAYASDLMAPTQGAVTAVITSGAIRYFAVSGVGFYGEDNVKVAEGTIESGVISYGLADQKVAISLMTMCKPLIGSYEASVSYNRGSYVVAGTNATDLSTTAEFPINQQLVDDFQVKIRLSREDSSDTVGPTFIRWSLRANPAASTGYLIVAPFRLHEEMRVGGLDVPLVPLTEFSIIDELRTSQRVVIYQEGSAAYRVTVDDVQWLPESFGRENAQVNGVCVVTMKTVI